ncbi:TPA: hypothetical protein ACTSD9_003152, partial [Legionella pneumophila]
GDVIKRQFVGVEPNCFQFNTYFNELTPQYLLHMPSMIGYRSSYTWAIILMFLKRLWIIHE